MNKCMERLKNGIVTENPTFVQMLGMCPTLAVTTSAMNGLGMGLTTTVILTLSNFMISALRKVIPDKVRIPAFIVIVASFVTMVQFLLEAYVPGLYEGLGIYIPLIVVNCIILGRAEAYASKNAVLPSIFDGVGMGLGFTIGLTCIGAFREVLGAGMLFGIQITPKSFEPVMIFGQAPGAFFVLAGLVAILNAIALKKKGTINDKINSGCQGECGLCMSADCQDKGKKTDEATVLHVKQETKEKVNEHAEVIKEDTEINTGDIQDEAETIQEEVAKKEEKEPQETIEQDCEVLRENEQEKTELEKEEKKISQKEAPEEAKTEKKNEKIMNTANKASKKKRKRKGNRR